MKLQSFFAFLKTFPGGFAKQIKAEIVLSLRQCQRIFLLYGFRVFFYGNENDEPAHIHVRKSDGEGKIWLEPAPQIAWTKGFTPKEESTIWQITLENEELFKNRCHEYFG